LQHLILVCKDCNKNATDPVTIWGYGLASKQYISMDSIINILPVTDKEDAKPVKLRPSAAAINPVTNELYVLNSINRLLVITDRKGKLIATHELDPDIYQQPEGIAFTPWGDLLITNEFVDNVSANVLVIKNKKKGL
jgi:DNA-binding beta-propeller fold protein YncE